MPMFRKKPVVIEARELLKSSESEIMEWCDGRRSALAVMAIATLEGTMRADYGDWIIKGVNGEFYPCKPDIFLKTYEAVDDRQD